MMRNLKTKYMGIEIDNPVIIGACNMLTNPDKLKKAEDMGAAAVVYKSLFEEQILLDKFYMESKLTEYDDINAEMITTHPKMVHAGPDEYLMELSKARESISIPLIASLNAVDDDTWFKYALLLSETGVDAIELNFYNIPMDFNITAEYIEEKVIKVVKEIKSNVKIPVSVKLSPDYTNILNLIVKLDQAGVDGFVLFNSLFQPDIDIDNQVHQRSVNYSHEGDYKLSLRYSGLLYGSIKADICATHGIFSGADVIRLLLSGASSVQVVSALYKSGLTKIKSIINELDEWMGEKDYKSISEFQGKLSRKNLRGNPFVYLRAQYVDLLLQSEKLFPLHL
jgi:dihydroorotate dehydrogenase (fumarate)